MPRLQMSLSTPYDAACVMTSGRIQYGVPMTVRRLEMVELSCADTPKSASLAVPSSVSSTLPALRSRWISLRSPWRYDSPISTHASASAISSSSSVTPHSDSRSATEPAAQYSITIHSVAPDVYDPA
jgi:hypothetical protein